MCHFFLLDSSLKRKTQNNSYKFLYRHSAEKIKKSCVGHSSYSTEKWVSIYFFFLATFNNSVIDDSSLLPKTCAEIPYITSPAHTIIKTPKAR